MKEGGGKDKGKKVDSKDNMSGLWVIWFVLAVYIMFNMAALLCEFLNGNRTDFSNI